jgi:Amt family ammonium transporter
VGILSIGAFVFAASYLVWLGLRRSVGIRLKRNHEHDGGDLVEIGMRAYNLG